jgi:hypothetical protein
MNFSHFEGLLDEHDIVMVGYRGVDGHVVLDCPEVTKAWREGKSPSQPVEKEQYHDWL